MLEAAEARVTVFVNTSALRNKLYEHSLTLVYPRIMSTDLNS
jgi:hypothetical protein